MFRLAMSLIRGLAGGIGTGAMGLLGGLGLGKIHLIVLAFLIATIIGQAVALKFTSNAKDKAIAVAAAEKVAHASTKASFDHYRRQTERNNENQLQAIDKLAGARDEAKKESDRLSRLLRKHDLGHLARKKPGLIERRINRATEEAFRRIWWDPWIQEKEELDHETRRFIDDIDNARLCWLHYAHRTPDRLTGMCRFYPGLPAASEAESDSPNVPSPRGGARGNMRGDDREKPGADMPKPPPVRKPGPRIQRRHGVYA